MRRPNILLVITDQQRWDALGANGNPDIQTPHLDRLAAEGVNFDHCFVQNPVCMPSRASLLPGQYLGTLGITHMGVPRTVSKCASWPDLPARAPAKTAVW